MSVAAMHQLLAVCFTAFLSFPISHASVRLDGRSTGGLDSVDNSDRAGLSFLEPRFGYKAFVGLQPPPALRIGKRDCLSNGSNFCFGNNVNFCADCGTCCVDGLYCCGKGGICCGKGCCASGETCSQDGKCQSPANVVTVISTVYETSTYTEHREATVVIVEIATSTILSTVETTISNAATQTDVHWVTATVTATPSPKAAVRRANSDGESTLSKPKRSFLDSLILRGFDFIHHGAALHRKEVVTVAPPAATAAASTVTKLTTQLSTVTEHDVKSFTETSTSYVMTIIYETVTKVLNAQTTVQVTSTLTITSHQPTTRIIITTADAIRPATPSATSTQSSSGTWSTAHGLPTPAIAGIAVGSAAAAILLLAIVIFLIRRRRLREPSFDMAHPPPGPPEHMHTRQPTLPNLLPQFAPSAPAHHAAPASLPKGYVSPNPASSCPGHQRTGSGFSTLIGTPSLGAGGLGGLKAGDRRSGFSMGSGTTLEHQPPAPTSSPVDVPGSQVPEWYEADGKPLVVVNSESLQQQQQQNNTASSPPLPPLPPSPTRPQVHRQAHSFYYHFPSPGQRMDQAAAAAAAATALPETAEELDGGDIAAATAGRTSPLVLTVSQTTDGGSIGSGSSSPVGNYAAPGAGAGQQDHQVHQYPLQQEQQYQRQYQEQQGQGQGQGQQPNPQQTYYYPGS